MEPHEWANQLTRTVGGSVRTLDAITSRLNDLSMLAGELRTRSILEERANRQIDDVSVGITGISDEISELQSRVDWLYQDLRAALSGQ